MTPIEQILAEIKRRQEELRRGGQLPGYAREQRINELFDLERFVNTLLKAQFGSAVCKDVEYEAFEQGNATGLRVKQNPSEDLEREISRYQREDMDRDTTVMDVARYFAKWQKEQMLKDAVEGIVTTRSLAGNIVTAHLDYRYRNNEIVKLIIIKED